MDLSADHQASKEPEAAVLTAIRRGFLLWSWIGLLSAYISTSAVYGSQMITIVTQGIERLNFASYWTLTVASLMFPVAVLMMGWLLFSRYSRAILAIALIPESESSGRKINSKELGYLFNASINYLIFSWIAILLAILLPYIAILIGRSR
jgi:hypothetical protein